MQNLSCVIQCESVTETNSVWKAALFLNSFFFDCYLSSFQVALVFCLFFNMVSKPLVVVNLIMFFLAAIVIQTFRSASSSGRKHRRRCQ